VATLPALVKTYSCRANVPFQGNATAKELAQSMIWSLKENLTGTLTGGSTSGARHANSLWTVKSSTNGGGVGALNDGIDRWTAHTSLVWAASASPHSWIILENATLGYQICIDCSSATTSVIGITVTEIGAPYIGGSFSGARPISTAGGGLTPGEFAMGTTGTGVGATFTFISDVVVLNFNWTHFITEVDGSFHFLSSRTGFDIFTTWMSLKKTVNNTVTDTRNIFIGGESSNGGRGVPTTAMLSTFTGQHGLRPNGSHPGTSGGAQQAGNFANTSYPSNSGIDALSGNYLAFPVGVICVGTQVAYRGEIPDLYSVGLATVGASIPSVAAQERVIAGNFIIPFPGVAPTI